MSGVYVALKPCGCLSAVTVDEPHLAKSTSKDVAQWIREGRQVQHMTDAEFRAVPWKCTHEAASEPEENSKQGELPL